MPTQDNIPTLKDKLASLEFASPSKRSANVLRKQADVLDRRKRARPRPNHPPQLSDDDAAEMTRLRDQINNLEEQLRRFVLRALERQIAELEDERKSSTALRHIADEMVIVLDRWRQAQERRRREQAEAEARRQREWQKQYDEAVLRRHGRDPMAILNLPSDATPNEVKARYRELVKKLHPDANAGNEAASGLLRQIMDAMDLLRAAGRAG
jgi:hypothetical protein